ncbi:MAG: hypothetical protein GC152_05085 [Alphaproteobacteria bacterium]|nr:hypothetical protein [Alphaproteobacteria bacterium]
MDQLFGFLPFLFFLLFFFFLPAMSRRRRGEELERAFAKIQKKRKSRILAIVHRQEPMGLLGIPMLQYIDLNDAEDVLEAIRTTPKNMPLEIILHTPGGLVLPALQIARAVKAHPGPTRIYVPHYAMSGGTLIALAADEIVLNPHAVLGPIDPQIGGLPAASVIRVTQTKSPDAIGDQTLVLADIGRMAMEQLERAARELLKGTVSENAAIAVAEQLSSGRWTHDYPIEASEARELGLNVSNDVPDDIMEIMRLFPDKMSRTSTTYFDNFAGIFGRSRKAARRTAPDDQTARPPFLADRTPFTGFEPGPGSRSFSYGPWDPKDLRRQLPPGPAADEIRSRRER